jgi:hypothetical protein
VFVDGERLAAKDFSPQEWDNIMQPVIKFDEQKKWNDELWQTNIKRLLPFADAAKFNNNITKEEFDQWYQSHLQNLLDRKINKIDMISGNYDFMDDTFKKGNY